ncbi:MAG: hypothetical protein ABSB19_08200 [Methylomonas sp.]|jgi:hypothetical protein
MDTKLSDIRRLKVVDISIVPGDAGIRFEKGISLAIYNNFEINGLKKSDANNLIGIMLTDVYEDKNTIILNFENDVSLQIDLRDEAYTGPEALELWVPGKPIVVWN